MAWFFRVVERSDGRWACRHGLHEYDSHSALAKALAHMRAIATAQPPAQLFVHRLDGTVESIEVPTYAT